MNTKLFGTSEYDIAEAGKMIAQGKLVAFPTETVYGLGADALNDEAVHNIYRAKGRPSDNPLIVHIAEKEDIVPLVKEVTPKAKALIDAFFPAPLTIILNNRTRWARLSVADLTPLPFVCRKMRLHASSSRRAVVRLLHRAQTLRDCRHRQGLNM